MKRSGEQKAVTVTVPSGYRYKFDGTRNWRTSSDEKWDTVVGSEARGRLLGYRTIDGSQCAVVRLGHGNIVAAMRHMVRNRRGDREIPRQN